MIARLLGRWQYLCYILGHGPVVDLDGRPVRPWGAISGKCSRCGYVGGVDDATGRLFWS